MSLRLVRTGVEVTVLVLGGTVGVGTVPYALAVGPITHVSVPPLACESGHGGSGGRASPPGVGGGGHQPHHQRAVRGSGMESRERGPYTDRDEAGDVLGARLAQYAGRDDVVVLGLPRGGVPVAVRVAAALGAPLDVLVVRKLGLPGQPELAMGAIAGVGDAVEVIRNHTVLASARVSDDDWGDVYGREVAELQRREADYRAGRPAVLVHDRVVIVVDDGLATGSTMRAAAAAVCRQRPSRLVVAVPAGATETCDRLREEVDEVLCAWTPEPFLAVGRAYRDFDQTTDEQVRDALTRAADDAATAGDGDAR